LLQFLVSFYLRWVEVQSLSASSFRLKPGPSVFHRISGAAAPEAACTVPPTADLSAASERARGSNELRKVLRLFQLIERKIRVIEELQNRGVNKRRENGNYLSKSSFMVSEKKLAAFEV
jgi:hypothetical protein